MNNFEGPIGRLIDELDELGKQRDDAWQIPREEGILLYQIAVTMQARTVVEIGSSYGFSGLFWGAAMLKTGGTLHTIDINQKKFEASKANFVRAGLEGVVMNYLGDGQKMLAKMPASIDLGFIDADKPATSAYFELLWPRIRPGGGVIVDNISTHAAQMADYVARVKGLANSVSSTIAIGNGIEWTVKV